MKSLSISTDRLKFVLVRLIRLLSQPNTYLYIALILFTLLISGTLLIWVLEQQLGGEPGLAEPGGAFTYMLQNVSGVYLGALPPSTAMGRLVAVFVILIAAAARAVLVAAIVSGFVNRLLIQGRGKGRVKMQGHILICGWNSRVRQIIEVLQREAFGAGVPVVLLAQLPQNPYPDMKLTFLSGNPAHSQDLVRAGVMTARGAIAVTDESDNDPHMDSAYDARAVLTVLALKQVNPQLHVVAQMRDPHNHIHLERAHADEIIASAEMSEGLLARAVLNAGLANAFAMLLRLDTPQELYVIDPPPALQGKTFQAALVHEQLRSGNILVGVIEGHETIMCPPAHYRVHNGTRLVVLGNLRPPLSH